MTDAKFEIPLPPRSSHLLAVAFRPTRTRIVSLQFELPAAQQPTHGSSEWMHAFMFHRALSAPPESMSLHVKYEGETLELLHTEWKGAEFDLLVGAIATMTADVQVRILEEEVARRDRQKWLYLALRRDPPGPSRFPCDLDYKKFFRQFDFATNPAIFRDPHPDDRFMTPVQETSRCEIIHRTAEHLWERVRLRKDESSFPLRGLTNPPLPDTCIEYLSGVQLEIIVAQPIFKPAGTRGSRDLAWERIDRAFELFASGNLEPDHGGGQGPVEGLFNYRPDSANVFLFAEFALLAMERTIETEYWSRLLDTFIRVQRVFLETYDDLNAPFNPMPKRLSEEALGRIRDRYRGAEQLDLITDVMQETLAEAYRKGFNEPRRRSC